MMGPEERELFAKGIRHATTFASGAALDDALEELGWRDALALDEQATVATLFELQGAAATASSALDVVVAAALGVDLDASTGVVLPVLGGVDVPGRVVGGALAVSGLGTGALRVRPRALVMAGDGVHVVDTSALSPRPVDGIDPRLGLVELAADGVPAGSLSTTADDRSSAAAAVVPAGSSAPSDVAWAAAVAAGQRAIAHELVGASRSMLQLAREHAVERVQFDRPIAAFQAVRHRLADSLVAIEAADAAATAAWDDGSPRAAALAKAIAGRSSRTVARHCQQVLAGIGFTTEHALHRYVRRVLVLDRVLGDARSLTVALGEELLRAGRLPTMLPL